MSPEIMIMGLGGLISGQRDFRPEMMDFRPDRTDFRSERADIGSRRPNM